MSKSRSNNIFINIALGLSLALSTLGGSFLMINSKAEHQRRLLAETTGLPSEIPFYAVDSQQTATGINNGVYTYNDSEINYVDVKGLIYYVKDSNVYSDITCKEKAKDIKREYIKLEYEYITISNNGTSTKYYIKDDSLYTDPSCSNPYKIDGVAQTGTKSENSFEYNGTDYTISTSTEIAYIKNNNLYTDWACLTPYKIDGVAQTGTKSENSFEYNGTEYKIAEESPTVNDEQVIIGDSPYPIQKATIFNIDGTLAYFNNGMLYSDRLYSKAYTADYDIVFEYKIEEQTHENTIERHLFGNSYYYKITDTDYYVPVKSINYNKLYTLNDNVMTECKTATITSVTPKTLYTLSSLTGSGSISNNSINVFGTRYYTYGTELYNKSYFTEPDYNELKINGTGIDAITFAEAVDKTNPTEITLKNNNSINLYSVKYNDSNQKTYYVEKNYAENKQSNYDKLYILNELNTEATNINDNNSTCTINANIDTNGEVQINTTSYYYPITFKDYYDCSIAFENNTQYYVKSGDAENLYVFENGTEELPTEKPKKDILDSIKSILNDSYLAGDNSISLEIKEESSNITASLTFTFNTTNQYGNYHQINETNYYIKEGDLSNFYQIKDIEIKDIGSAKKVTTYSGSIDDIIPVSYSNKYGYLQAVNSLDYTIARNETNPKVNFTVTATDFDNNGTPIIKYDNNTLYIYNGRAYLITSENNPIERSGENGTYSFESTFNISNTVITIDSNTGSDSEYNGVYINNKQYYVKSGDTSKLYIITGDGSQNNKYVVSEATNMEFKLNSIDPTNKEVTVTFKYQFNNGVLTIAKDFTAHNSSYIVYNAKYYYYNNELYIHPVNDETYEVVKKMEDFDYSSNVTAISLNNNNYPVFTDTYTYTTINGKYYYIYNNELYATMIIGSDDNNPTSQISYLDQVTNIALDYDIDDSRKLVMIYECSDNQKLTVNGTEEFTTINSDSSKFKIENGIVKALATTSNSGFNFNNVYYTELKETYNGVQYYVARDNATAEARDTNLSINVPTATRLTDTSFSITEYDNENNEVTIGEKKCSVSNTLVFDYASDANNDNIKSKWMNVFIYNESYYGFIDDTTTEIYKVAPASTTAPTGTTTPTSFTNILVSSNGNYYIPKYFLKYEDNTTSSYKYFDFFDRTKVYTISGDKLSEETKSFEIVWASEYIAKISIGGTSYNIEKIDEKEENSIYTNGTNIININNGTVKIDKQTAVTINEETINHATFNWFDQEYLNLNIEIGFESGYAFFKDGTFSKPNTIKINSTELEYMGTGSHSKSTAEWQYKNATNSTLTEATSSPIKIYSDLRQSELNGFIVLEFIETTEIKYYSILMKYNEKYYYIFCGSGNSSFEMYLADDLNSSNSDLYYKPTGNDYLLNFYREENSNNSIFYTGFRSFKLKENGLGAYDVYEALAYNNFVKSGTEYKINYNNHDYTIDNGQLYYNKDKDIDAKEVNFSYNPMTLFRNTVAYNYIKANGCYYILDSTNTLYKNFTYNLKSLSYLTAGDEVNATRISDQVFFPIINENFMLISSNNLRYQDNQDTIKNKLQYPNQSEVILENYLANINLSNGKTNIAIQTLYVQFGEIKKFEDNSSIARAGGITSLNVQAFLKNEETAKFYSESPTEAYNVDYGVRIKIDNAKSQSVKYADQTNQNQNWYWFGYFDTRGVKALLTSDSTSSGTGTTSIKDGSGYYTIVFNYSYWDSKGNLNAGQKYIYQFYISEDSQYIDYPSFNSELIINTGTDTEKTSIVNKTTASDNQYNYYYNFETRDVPAYVFNASLYAVDYSFKYNLDSRNYTTNFEIFNTASGSYIHDINIAGGEYGLLTVYKNGAVDYTLKIVKSNQNTRALDYYKNNVFYGSLYIEESTGKFLLSLENNSYYNSKNKVDYNPNDYYQNGRLVKTGAKNTPLDYYVVLLLDELGDYEFKNIRLLSQGVDASCKTTFVKYPKDVNSTGANCIFDTSKYYLDSENNKITGHDLMAYGQFTEWLFEFNNNVTINQLSNTPNSNGSLKVFGIKTTFKKNDNIIDFKKSEDNIYSDITPNTIFKYEDNNNLDINNFTSSQDLANNLKGNTINFTGNNCSIPLTNLQPIYFNYFAKIIYGSSWYVWFTDFSTKLDANGNMESIKLGSSFQSASYTNKTSINKTGFYVVKITYYDEYNQNTQKTQYFMFVIDNTAPNMEIRVHDKQNDDGSLFVSSTDMGSTSRYTNKEYFTVNNTVPNYFQGDVRVTYKVLSYDQNTVLQAETNYSAGSYIKTIEGRYIFTMYYGVGSKSYNSTYVIVDKSAPSGDLYNVTTSLTGSTSYRLDGKYDYFAFSSLKTFVSNRKKQSGATISAKIKAISLSTNPEFANALGDFEAITTNVMINAGNELFNKIDLSDSPTYNFTSNTSGQLTDGQIIGNTSQSTIYIIKLYDNAGNETYYYYFYDASRPYLLYQDLSKTSSTEIPPQKTIENNTVQGNTRIIWGNNKAIYIDETDAGTNNLYTSFINRVKADPNKYKGITVKTVNGKLYLFVPLSGTTMKKNIGGEDVTATTSSTGGTFTNSAYIYTTKYAESHSLTLQNDASKWMLGSNTSVKDMFGGDATYHIRVNDILENTLSSQLTMNSSFAQETFYGVFGNNNNPYKLDTGNKARPAYSVSGITVQHKKLDETDSVFKPKISYDYYYFAPDNYLTNEAKQDANPYSEIAYNTINGNLYKYNESYYLCDDINEYTYSPDSTGYKFSTLNASGGMFIAGYPYSLSQKNQDIGKGEEQNETVIYNTINQQGENTAEGLYVFRRIYTYNSTGEMVTQNDIETAGDSSDLSVLKDDYAVRYYVLFVDRKGVIELTYNGDKIDNINSVGDLLKILLGSEKDSQIDAELLKTYENNIDTSSISTSKLRVKSSFPVDKYATVNKLEAKRSYTTGTGDDLNYNAEEYIKKLNNSVFKYKVTLNRKNDSNINEIVFENKCISDAEKEQFFDLYQNGDYTLTITDNSALEYIDSNNEPKYVGGNSYTFTFGITYSSPEGEFQTKSDDTNGTITPLETRNIADISADGKNVIYKNINKDYLQFSFTEKLGIYDAQVNPYNVIIQKNGTTVLQTKESAGKGSVISTFETSTVPVGATYSDIIKVSGDAGDPKTYTFVIFDKSSNATLLGKSDENATYKVILEFKGTGSDYMVTSSKGTSNYFRTTYQISVDTYAPEDNLNELASKDKVLNDYCVKKYGKVYTLLTASERKDLLKNYVFAVSYLDMSQPATTGGSIDNSLTYLAKKEGYPAIDVENIGNTSNTSADIVMTRKALIAKYSTIFKKDYNDSVKLYFRAITENLAEYQMSYLPNEDGDNRVQVFNKYDNTTYVAKEYSHEILLKDNKEFSFTSEIDTGKMKPGYYEVFEEDEAGNLSRYLIYLSDNTRVEYGVNYELHENSKNDTPKTYYANVNNSICFVESTIVKDPDNPEWSCVDIYGNSVVATIKTIENVPQSITIGGEVYPLYPLYTNKIYTFTCTKVDKTSETYELTYDSNNRLWTINKTNFNITQPSYTTAEIDSNGNVVTESFPINVTIGGADYENETVDTTGFKIYNSFEEASAFAMYRLNRIIPIIDSNYSAKTSGFDQFITVKVYSGVKNNNNYSYTLLDTHVSEPKKLSISDFFKTIIADIQYKTQTAIGVYTYKLEVSNRFGDNFNIIIDLPDANLVLKFDTVDSLLQVTLPDASTNVMLKVFKVEKYENNKWQSVVKDQKGKFITNQNIDEPEKGLIPAIYYFNNGSYKFYIKDNYNRESTVYKYVGENKTDSIRYFFSTSNIQNANHFTTAGNLEIQFDASLYQVKILLKDCIKLGDSYYSILSMYEGDKIINLVGTLEGSSFTQLSDDNNLIYFFNGELYMDGALKNKYLPNNNDIVPNIKSIFEKVELATGLTSYTLKGLENMTITDYAYFINWATDIDNVSFYELTIDKTEPKVVLTSENGSNLSMKDGANYYQQFTITWESKYNSTGYLTIKKNTGEITIITINPTDHYVVSEIAKYDLRIRDEIGNIVNYSFSMISSSNAYFSVFNGTDELFESDYIESYYDESNTDFNGKIIKHYYYLDTQFTGITIQTDISKNIEAEEVSDDPTLIPDGSNIRAYKISRKIGKNQDVILCLVRVIPVKAIGNNSSAKDVLKSVKINDEEENDISNSYTLGQECKKFVLNVKGYNENQKGNKIFVSHYYNDTFVKQYSLQQYSSDTTEDYFQIEVVATGIHTFKIHDLVGNMYDDFTVTMIRDVVFSANGESAIDNRFYNDNVTITIPQMLDFYNTPTLVVEYNGAKYGGDGQNINDIANYISATRSYTFTKSGFYRLTMTAQKSDTSGTNTTFKSEYCFTIINPNVMKMTFGFSSIYGFTIEKIVRNSLDITNTLKTYDSLWLTSGNPDSAGLYTITLKGYNSLINDYSSFTFNVRINSETPSITPVNYSYGNSTTKNVVLQYNGALIYSQVGESYIEISKDGVVQGVIEINKESLDELSTINLSNPGKWTIAIYNNDGNFITSYTVNKATPLNSSARLIIIIGAILLVVLIVAFIILRKHTKFR